MSQLCGAAACLMLLAGALVCVPSAHSQTVRTWDWELYGGLYFPTPEPFGVEPMGGFRIARTINPHANVRAQFGFLSEEDQVTSTLQTKVDMGLIEISGVYVANPEDTVIGSLHGGLGWAFVSASGLQDRPEGEVGFVEGIERDSFSAHAGLGGEYFINPGVYLRALGNARWYETRSSDSVDFEVTLGVGFAYYGPQG